MTNFLDNNPAHRIHDKIIHDYYNKHPDISKSGKHTAFPKEALLAVPLMYLKFLVLQLRAMTIETRGRVSPNRLLAMSDCYMRLYTGKEIFSYLQNNPTVQKKIVSYLMHGSSGSIGRAAKNYLSVNAWPTS